MKLSWRRLAKLSLLVVNKINELKDIINTYKKQGKTVALVPTMGCLHDGHMSLMVKASDLADITVASIFVNPIQFCPGEDYDKYPRTLEDDKKVAESAGADIIFAPSVGEMYPNLTKFSDLTMVVPPYELTDIMCGKSRVGHFDGVLTVVSKLFNIVQPDYACFGLKDIQQLFLIKKMVKDLNIPVEIVPCPLVREESGLALSSRNKYLSDSEKKLAISISKSIFAIKEAFDAGIKDSKKLFDIVFASLNANVDLEYLEFVEFETFKPVDIINTSTICAIAARVGNVRLIDNIILEV